MTQLEYITDAAGRFYNEAGFEKPENMKEYYEELSKNPLIFTKTIIGKGFIVGMIAPSFLHPDRLQCSELAWYVETEYRGTSVALRLMKMYEQHAKDRGCDKITMVCLESLNPLSTGNIYKKLGYNKLETHFIKEV